MVYWMEAVEAFLQQDFFLCLLFEASAGCVVSPRRRLIWGRTGRGLASALPLVGHIPVLALAENHRALGSSLLGSEWQGSLEH